MKRIGIALLLFLVAFSLFAASKPSVEGRAAVAEENVFPIGFFAKAIGFLPGDSVMVTNPVTGDSVNVLILGTLEQDGTAILLSPEAAERLFITKDSNTLVSVTKRIAQTETTGTKNAISDPDNRPEDAIPLELDEKLRNQQNQAPDNPRIVTSIPTPPSANENVRISDEKTTVAESEELLNKVEALLAAHETAITQSATAESEKILNQMQKLLDENEAARTSPVTPEMEETLDKLKSVLDAKAHPMIPPDSTVKLAYSEPVTPSTPIIIAPREAVRVTDSGTVETPPPQSDVIPTQPPPRESVKVTETPKPPVATTDTKKAESPAIGGVRLMPAPPVKPPEVAQEPPVKTAPPKVEEGIPLTPPPIEKPPQSPPSSVAQTPVTPPPSPNKITSLTVDAAKLRSGSYYIQIATMSNEKNINNLLADYSDKYPIALVPSPTSTAYQVLIGPLSVDEYGAVLARFKTNGFKDAFVKKIR
jgi:hypothetical protein